ncbi:MAG: carboxypeptidase-like regulatory domain-containing protein, partial [Bacteroidales bacterium]
MKKLVLSLLCGFIAFTAVVSAASKAEQTLTKQVVSGRILDKDTQEALAGALIIADGQKVYSDFDGNFRIEKLCGEKCQMMISLISYEQQTIEVEFKSDSQNLNI